MSQIERITDTTAAAELAAAKAAAEQALNGTGALVPLGGAGAEATRQAYAVQRAEATRVVAQAKAALDHRREEIKARQEALRRQLDAEMAELNKVLEPLREQMKMLTEGLWTVDLYLGRDEQIQTLADGEPAGADEPIVLRQLVLAMDEECLIAAKDGGIDAARRDDFLDWLTRDPAHLQQVLPDRKGVVVLVPSRQKRQYGSPIVDAAMEEANAESHWLIRNGDKLFVMVTNLNVGDRLLPTRAEFVDFFTRAANWEEQRQGIRRVPLEPGGDEWVKAEQAADKHRRHYMRIMLVLQGLADRTTVFHPLPVQGVNFLSLDSQDSGAVRIINEIDNVLTSGRKPFREWQAELNAKLRPGMRIIGEFAGSRFHDCNSNDSRYDRGHSRLHPALAEYPDSRVIHYIEAKEGRDLKFLYRRTREEWLDGEYRIPKTRASCVVRATDRFILPFDLVTEAELVAYLNARTERHDYLDMVPVIKAAIAAKRAEAAAEAPFRTLLAGRIAAQHGLDVTEVEAQLPELVTWWKLTNRHHRPLVTDGDPELEAKAIRMIEREWATRTKAADVDAARDARAVEQIRRELTNAGDDPADSASDVICIARKRDGSYVAFCPEPGEREESVWLVEHRFTKTLSNRTIRNWVTLTGRSRAALTVLWSTPEWESWNHDADPREHLTRREYHEVTAAMTAKIKAVGHPIAVTYARGNEWDGQVRCFAAYAWAHDPRPDRGWDGRRVGDGMVKVVAVWKRDRAGDVELEFDRFTYAPQWDRFSNTDAPWEKPGSYYAAGRPHLIWSDPQQLARVQQWQAEDKAREAKNRERTNRIWAVRQHVDKQWREAELARRYQRFLEDYAGATDLWEGHRKALKIEYREPNWLYGLVDRALDAGADLAGLTIAAAAAAHPDTEPVDVPDDFADLTLADPAEPAAEETQ